jgi:hypothetical protein
MEINLFFIVITAFELDSPSASSASVSGPQRSRRRFVQKLYDEYFGKPNSHKAHELLHTTYVKRPKYN